MTNPADPFIRPARPDDAGAIARILHEASHGLALHFWTLTAKPGEDPWVVGEKRQAERIGRDEILVVDEGAGPVAGLIGYVIGDQPETIGPDTPPLVRPLIELENTAPGAWYINALAALPGNCGRGLGTRLLAAAEVLARTAGCAYLCLICADDNSGALRLYARHGFRETARRAMVHDGREGAGQTWILMTKPVGASNHPHDA